MLKDEKKIRNLLILAAVLALLILYSRQLFQGAGVLWGIMLPLFSGAILAYILNLVMIRIEAVFFPNTTNQRMIKIRPAACIVLSILLVISVFLIIIHLVVPELIKAISMMAINITMYVNRLLDNQEISERYPFILAEIESWIPDETNLKKEILDFVTKGASGILNSAAAVIGSVGSAVFGFFVTFSFAVYILSGKQKLQHQANRLARAFIPENFRRQLLIVLGTAHETFSSFIVGQLTEAVILGGLCTVGMLLFRIPYSGVVGAIIGVSAMIPVLGAWIGAAVGVLLILPQDMWKAVIFVIFIVILQQLENNLIYPRVVGTSIGLPGIWVLSAITLGAGIGGIFGILLSVPLAATAYKLLGMYVDYRLSVKTVPKEVPVAVEVREGPEKIKGHGKQKTKKKK